MSLLEKLRPFIPDENRSRGQLRSEERPGIPTLTVSFASFERDILSEVCSSLAKPHREASQAPSILVFDLFERSDSVVSVWLAIGSIRETVASLRNPSAEERLRSYQTAMHAFKLRDELVYSIFESDNPDFFDQFQHAADPLKFLDTLELRMNLRQDRSSWENLECMFQALPDEMSQWTGYNDIPGPMDGFVVWQVVKRFLSRFRFLGCVTTVLDYGENKDNELVHHILSKHKKVTSKSDLVSKSVDNIAGPSAQREAMKDKKVHYNHR
jgi:hypothetical protein